MTAKLGQETVQNNWSIDWPNCSNDCQYLFTFKQACLKVNQTGEVVVVVVVMVLSLGASKRGDGECE